MNKMMKIFAPLSAILAGTAIVLACNWGFADGCQDANCGTGCTTGNYVLTMGYCQVQGNYCCTCFEEVYLCNGTNCNPAFRYDRTTVSVSIDNCVSMAPHGEKCSTVSIPTGPGGS